MQQPRKDKTRVGRPDTPLAATPEPKVTYKNLGLARTAANNAAGDYTNTPATAKDSADYRSGFRMGVKGKKVSDLENKYQGKNQYVEKGRWEGQNAVKDIKKTKLKELTKK
jgi:hypothetical protein